MLGVAGGMHDCQRSWVTLARAAGITGTETNNSPEFAPSDTSIEGLREDDSVHV